MSLDYNIYGLKIGNIQIINVLSSKAHKKIQIPVTAGQNIFSEVVDFEINIKDQSIELIVSKMGADIPFFIRGGLQLAKGIGHNLEAMEPLCKNYYFLLVCPSINISTKWAYEAYRKYLEISTIKTKFHPLSDKVEWSLLENDFEKVVLSTYPEIKKIKDNFEKDKPLFSSLSGSGSTMFGVYDSLESVNHASDLFKHHQTYKALPVY